jgi:hypothetical protein
MFFTYTKYSPPHTPIDKHATPWNPTPQIHDWIITEVRAKPLAQLDQSYSVFNIDTALFLEPSILFSFYHYSYLHSHAHQLPVFLIVCRG